MATNINESYNRKINGKEVIAFLDDYYTERNELISFDDEKFIMEELSIAFAKYNKSLSYNNYSVVVVLLVIFSFFILLIFMGVL